jgi:hypothetical protein
MEYTRGLLALPAIKNIEEVIKGLAMPIELTKGSYRKLEFRFKNNVVSLIHNGIDIKQYSHIWLSSSWTTRDLAYAAKLYLKEFHIPHTFVEKVTSKVTDQMKFILSGIVTPDTFYVDTAHILKHLDTIETICGYPLIIKDIAGSRGKNSGYITNRTELLEKLANLPKNKKYIYQRYIPNDYDWGILVSNGVVVSAEKSYPSIGEFRNNCNGAKEEFVDVSNVPEEIKAIAIHASKVLKLKWSRSDIIVDKNTGAPYLMEVNRLPGVSSGTKEVSGAQSFLQSHINKSLGQQSIFTD